MTRYPDVDNRALRNALRVGANNLRLGVPVPHSPFTGFGLLQIQSSLDVMTGIQFHPSYWVFP